MSSFKNKKNYSSVQYRNKEYPQTSKYVKLSFAPKINLNALSARQIILQMPFLFLVRPKYPTIQNLPITKNVLPYIKRPNRLCIYNILYGRNSLSCYITIKKPKKALYSFYKSCKKTKSKIYIILREIILYKDLYFDLFTRIIKNKNKIIIRYLRVTNKKKHYFNYLKKLEHNLITNLKKKILSYSSYMVIDKKLTIENLFSIINIFLLRLHKKSSNHYTNTCIYLICTKIDHKYHSKPFKLDLLSGTIFNNNYINYSTKAIKHAYEKYLLIYSNTNIDSEYYDLIIHGIKPTIYKLIS